MTLNNDDATGVLKIAGTLDIEGANSLREALLDCFLHQSEVTLNLSEVDICDTAALQVLLAAQKRAAVIGKAFRIYEAPSSVTDTAIALGLAMDWAEKGQDDAT